MASNSSCHSNKIPFLSNVDVVGVTDEDIDRQQIMKHTFCRPKYFFKFGCTSAVQEVSFCNTKIFIDTANYDC
jgi:hypothetical protein